MKLLETRWNDFRQRTIDSVDPGYLEDMRRAFYSGMMEMEVIIHMIANVDDLGIPGLKVDDTDEVQMTAMRKIHEEMETFCVEVLDKYNRKDSSI